MTRFEVCSAFDFSFWLVCSLMRCRRTFYAQRPRAPAVTSSSLCAY